MKIAIGTDHAGVELKTELIKVLETYGAEVLDQGPFSSESVDYPDFGHKVAALVSKDVCSLGVVICGSGNGINMTVNKYQNVRGALCWLPEIAVLARQHNDANVIAIPARFLSMEEAREVLKAFLTNEFEGGRHKRRVEKIACN